MKQKNIKTITDQRPFSMIYHDCLKSDLFDNPYQIVLYVYLKMFTDSKNQCFPSLKTLAKLTKIGITKIKTTLLELEEKGIITKEKRTRPDGGKSSNLYTLYDYKKLWNAGNGEEVAAAIDEIEENRMIEALTAKGYYINKEKGLDSTEPSKVTAEPSTQQQLNQFDMVNTTTNSLESQLERYTISQIKQLFQFDIILTDHPDLQRDADSVMNVLHTAMNTSKETIRIAGEDKPAMVVIGKLMKLDKEFIIYAIKKFSEQTERIKNPAAYMLTILYNAPEQYHLDIKNQVSHDMAKANHSQEEEKTNDKPQKSQNGFDNFEQRNYNYNELERNLLKNQKGSESIEPDIAEMLETIRK